MEMDVQTILNETLEATQVGINICDSDDRFIYCNPACAKLFNLPVERILGRSWFDVMRHAYAEKSILAIDTDDIEAWLDKARHNRQFDGYRTFELDTRDGRWFLCSEYRHPSGSLVFQATENTRQKRLELQLIETKRQLEELVSHDDLTGLFNRRYFLEELNRTLTQTDPQFSDSSLLMIDLDYFKSINDNYGHASGDWVLQEFSHMLPELLRPYDQAARIGGEEFAVFLPGTQSVEGQRIAERIRKAVAEHNWPDIDDDFQLTLSIGGITCRPGVVAPDELLARADKALYQAKSSGRNRVVWEGTDISEA
ncbi:diguanylate cyclase [Saccharospirillum mangrovi]|uniref:sensor domain-containing diguanylate cyclase n=1 Tax=Saccharospirillum mangrovi TaxID=2161747 RepID=UPI000D3BFE71|nr:diguanylate cyclase [Saccharospirillum mangrovi]